MGMYWYEDNKKPENFYFEIPITIGGRGDYQGIAGNYEIGLCEENLECLYYYCFQKKMEYDGFTPKLTEEEKNAMEDVIIEQFYDWFCDDEGYWNEFQNDFNNYIGSVIIRE